MHVKKKKEKEKKLTFTAVSFNVNVSNAKHRIHIRPGSLLRRLRRSSKKENGVQKQPMETMRCAGKIFALF